MYVGLFVKDEYERSVKNQVSKDESVEFVTSSRVSHEKQPTKRPCVKYMTRSWRVIPSCQVRECFARMAILRSTHKTLCWQKFYLLYQILYPHYIYPLYPQIIRSAFQRENHSKYTWELEIVIPTIIYTIPCGFSQLLPLHLYILERLLVQTLPILILSVKWDFGVAGKHWKEPFIGGCNWLNCGIWKAREDKT